MAGREGNWNMVKKEWQGGAMLSLMANQAVNLAAAVLPKPDRFELDDAGLT